MKTSEKIQITDILNAFRLINKDIRKSFNIMCDKLESDSSFVKWKKWEKGNKNAKEDYADYTDLFDGGNWYYLNCYGIYNEKVIGFTFVISIYYSEKDDADYTVFLKQLDENINLNTPMLCISGVYSPIDSNNIKLLDKNGWHYVDTILQFTDDWNNYKKENIRYDKWLDVEIEYLKNNEIIEGYEAWYKNARVKINHITDISSQEIAERYIEELIEEAKIQKA